MDKAYLCPKCSAQVILDNQSEKMCVFCSTPLKEENSLEKVDWGYYTPGFASGGKTRAYVCRDCGKVQYALFDSDYSPKHCVYCASERVELDERATKNVPRPFRTVPFIYKKLDAVEEYKKAVKKEQLKFMGCASDTYLKKITPLYVPCFLFDYHVFSHSVLSVVPIVKAPRQTGEKVFTLLTTTELSFEVTNNDIQPYPKEVSFELVWQNVPICASSLISKETFDKISPFVLRNRFEDGDVDDLKKATILAVDEDPQGISDILIEDIKKWTKDFVISEYVDHYSVSSYVDKTEYDRGLGQLIYLPVWQMVFKKKNQTYAWYMNAISGEPTDILPIEEKKEEVKEEKPKDPLKAMSKKRIKKFSISDVAHPEFNLNFRTYLVDTVAAAISLETNLNEASSDKTLYHLERKVIKGKVEVAIPDSDAFQKEAAEEVVKGRLSAIPSEPVPLPEVHSQLYLMKEEVTKRSLGRGKRLPEKPIDRKIGNEEYFEANQDTHESLAVEFGLSDMPEYDPSGPNPFKKSNQ
ncbi:MAG: hypothetical protein J6Y08_11230 [Clostridiales bacterium]|nr:hypothetical protein [Clostridiales bacterium]